MRRRVFARQTAHGMLENSNRKDGEICRLKCVRPPQDHRRLWKSTWEIAVQSCVSGTEDIMSGAPNGSTNGSINGPPSEGPKSFFCARRSAFMRCFSCLFISFWRFWNVDLEVAIESP